MPRFRRTSSTCLELSSVTFSSLLTVRSPLCSTQANKHSDSVKLSHSKKISTLSCH